MNTVFACIDGLTNSAAVVDGAAWCARRLQAPLELLHVLTRDPRPADVSDFSGAIGLGSQEALLQELSEVDEQRARLALELAQGMLAAAAQRAASAGASSLGTLLRHGHLVDTVLELEPLARLFVMGEHHHASGESRRHLDHHVEQVVRSVERPVLVMTEGSFAPPRHVMVAFDGSATSRKALSAVAKSPLLEGLPLSVVTSGHDSGLARAVLDDASAVMAAAGRQAQTEFLSGEPEQTIPRALSSRPDTWLVMGAYGHSRIRALILGSTTTTLLRVCRSPILVLR